MAQADIQISTTPPLAGSTLVDGLNDALAALNTDFAGPVDPASFDGVGPYSTWADTLNGLLKRRNAANTAWVTEGKILANNSPDASETTAGLIEIATAAEAQAFASNKAIDGAKLAAAFGGVNQGLTTNGYQKLPGGLIIQWGTTPVLGTSLVSVTFPVAFPNACQSVALTNGAATSIVLGALNRTSTKFDGWASAGGNSHQYIAIGY